MPRRMQILGNIFPDQGLEANPEKIDAILKFPKPGNKKQLQRFRGMANYLRQFCPQLGSVAAPLTELQAAMEHWRWILKWVTCGRQSRMEQRMCERRGACEPAVEDEVAGAIAEDERSEDCLINYL